MVSIPLKKIMGLYIFYSGNGKGESNSKPCPIGKFSFLSISGIKIYKVKINNLKKTHSKNVYICFKILLN